MRKLLLSTALTLAGQAALAEDQALVFGTESYESLGRLSRGADVTTATSGISALGFRTTVLRDGNAAQTDEALSAFLDTVPEAERLIVVLSGRFATDGSRTWYLTADAPEPGILHQNASMVSVESLLAVLGARPGQALLLLAQADERDDAFDPWLSEGIGQLEIPQGVTVLAGEPRAIADYMSRVLSVPEGDLARLTNDFRGVAASGFYPGGFTFMPATPLPPAIETPAVDTSAADDALWRRVLAQDNVEAYRGYLRQFPAGRHQSEAEAAIAAILAEPFRDERLAEEALQLTRDQRREIQRDLTTMGFDTRGIDGIFGQGSRRAVTNWQQENGFAQTGYVTTEQIQRLDAQATRREAEQAAETERQRQEAERLDRAYWEETGVRGDEAGLRAYLSRYPQGLYADIANDELARLTAARAQAAAARDRAAWDAARGTDSIAAYRQYLRDFPQGGFAAEAQARIRSLEQGGTVVSPQPPVIQPLPDAGSVPVPVPPPANQAELDRARATEMDLSLNGLTARLVESRLAALGLDTGAVDGNFDDRTRASIRSFQAGNNLPATGFLDENTMVLLLAGALGGN